LDRALDVVGGHAALPGRQHRRPETRVELDVTPAETRGDGDLLDELREDLPALRVLRALLVLDRAPFGMTGHRKPPRKARAAGLPVGSTGTPRGQLESGCAAHPLTAPVRAGASRPCSDGRRGTARFSRA